MVYEYRVEVYFFFRATLNFDKLVYDNNVRCVFGNVEENVYCSVSASHRFCVVSECRDKKHVLNLVGGHCKSLKYRH